MDFSIRYIALIVLALLVVLGLLAATGGVFTNTGNEVTGAGEEKGRDIECILGSPDNPEHCTRDSDVEVRASEGHF